MHFLHRRAKGNLNLARRLYAGIYLNQRCPAKETFAIINQLLKDGWYFSVPYNQFWCHKKYLHTWSAWVKWPEFNIPRLSRKYAFRGPQNEEASTNNNSTCFMCSEYRPSTLLYHSYSFVDGFSDGTTIFHSEYLQENRWANANPHAMIKS